VADLRPGVGIEHVMASQANIRCAQQAPQIDQIGAPRLRQGLLFHQAEKRPVPDGGGEEGNQGTHPRRVRRGGRGHRVR
jgi:hypothetical protein